MPDTYRVAIPDLCDVSGLSWSQARQLVHWHLARIEPPEGYVFHTFRFAGRVQERIFRDKASEAVLAQIMREG